jgi:hypothetical protein
MGDETFLCAIKRSSNFFAVGFIVHLKIEGDGKEPEGCFNTYKILKTKLKTPAKYKEIRFTGIVKNTPEKSQGALLSI